MSALSTTDAAVLRDLLARHREARIDHEKLEAREWHEQRTRERRLAAVAASPVSAELDELRRQLKGERGRQRVTRQKLDWTRQELRRTQQQVQILERELAVAKRPESCCVYCGESRTVGSVACAKHEDLVALDVREE